MPNLKKYDLNGKELESVQIDETLIEKKAKHQMIKDYLVAIRNNQRQWSAKTKDRSEVKCTNAKPHPQKGTGNARQGSFVSPQYRGGGVVFGPRPKFDQHTRINKKEKRAAIRYLLSKKIEEGKISLLKLEGFDQPKTRVVDSFLKARDLKNHRVLFLGETAFSSGAENRSFIKSTYNIPKTAFKHLTQINGYDVSLCQEIVVLDSALNELLGVLEGGSKTT